VFVEDYDMKVAREMVQGVDLWLNTPRRGEEACGTSGMKAGMNGVLNLSILDGWFDEAYERSGGWAIGDREPYWEEQDSIHSSAIYYLLENEIVPMFYAHRENVAGDEWTRRVKQSLMYVSPQFDCRRMVSEYHSELYQPAHAAYTTLRKGNFENAREKALWNTRVHHAWDRVRIAEASPALAGSVTSGKEIQIRAAVDLGGLKSTDVRVEAVLGRVGPNGTLEDPEIIVLPPAEEAGGTTLFSKDIAPRHTGRLGYALRVSPNHYEDPLTRPCPDLLRWS
jgi:starch phosphorylase